MNRLQISRMDVFKELTVKTFHTGCVELSGDGQLAISSSYPVFFGALYRQERLLRDKCKEIDSFVFVPFPIDPELPIGQRMYLESINTREWQLRRLYGDILSDIRLSVIVFASSLLEGMINETLRNTCSIRIQKARTRTVHKEVDRSSSSICSRIQSAI